MAYDIIRRRQVARDWSCRSTCGAESPSSSGGMVMPLMVGVTGIAALLVFTTPRKGQREASEQDEAIRRRAMEKMARVKARA